MASEWHWEVPTTRTKQGYEVEVDYDSAGSTEDLRPLSEFDRFADLAKKLVRVPKSDVDEQRKRA